VNQAGLFVGLTLLIVVVVRTVGETRPDRIKEPEKSEIEV
jgi:hypothetical protein